MSEIKVGDGVTGNVVTLDANWSLNWHQHLRRERDEQEAALQNVAYRIRALSDPEDKS